MTSDSNVLYYGDNLEILRRYVPDESVDLVYLDPPFNSNATYNVLFAEQDGSRAAAQIKAFEDSWRWDEAAGRALQETIEMGGRPAEALRAFRTLLGHSDMLAYLAMMAPRLVELLRVLKPSGSLYLHCDPTASHYLKLLLDAIFGPEQFRSEVIWKRTSAHSSAKRPGPVHDVLLFYAKTSTYTWNPAYQPYDQQYLDAFYTHVDADGRRWRRSDLTGAGVRHGETGLVWRSIDVTAKGRHWFVPPSELDKLDAAGRIHWPKKDGGVPMLKRYIEDQPGVPLQDVWTDLPPLHNLAQERLGYPTQKPEALLERIITASSNEGDTVLDPFCGCGTTVAAAQRMGRRWIGIDITHLSIGLIKIRLQDQYQNSASYKVIGEPTTVDDVAELAKQDPFQFQAWALGLAGARIASSAKKGADKGIDGRLYFHDEGVGGKTKQIIISVKGGHVSVPQVRDLRGVIEREGAEIGVLLSFEPSTQPMRSEATGARFYQSPWGNHPRIQLLTVAELLSGKKIDYPPARQVNVTYKKAERVKTSAGEQLSMVAEPRAEYGVEDE